MKLAEVLVAAAIAFVLTWALVDIGHDAVFTAAHLDARLSARGTTDRLAERLESDAASAWSVFVPSDDVLGNANADGHELDFVTEDGAHATYWWAYDFSVAAQTVTAYSYVPGGAANAGDVYAGITGFSATMHAVTDVGDASSAIYDPLLAATAATPVAFDYGFAQSAALGGNRIALVRMSAPGIDRALPLATQTAPTHFTVVVRYTPAPTATP
ncbi:MAG TPA: hypothetical protein VMH02_05500 [Verrucomicrobiae bacterium]|nr:hypothetical protein [Verrucomicrobiae bacterium]